MMKRSFSELLRVRRDQELAQRGATVLEKMENAMTKELTFLHQKMDQFQHECHLMMRSISSELEDAKKRSILIDVEKLIATEPPDNKVEPASKKKFGKLISVMAPIEPKEPKPRWGASFSYEKAHKTSKRLLATIIDLGNAQIEADFTKNELAKARRRVNALRKIILPDLASKRKELEEWMEEDTREELGRRQWVRGVEGR